MSGFDLPSAAVSLSSISYGSDISNISAGTVSLDPFNRLDLTSECTSSTRTLNNITKDSTISSLSHLPLLSTEPIVDYV
ncbi:hypothetical protein HK098_007758, partial [Nowakowskiella sp. JEL0407]